jgi:hypothetical protein
MNAFENAVKALKIWDLMTVLPLVMFHDIEIFISNTQKKIEITTDQHVKKLLECALKIMNIHISIVNWNNSARYFNDEQYSRYFKYYELLQEFNQLRSFKETGGKLPNNEPIFAQVHTTIQPHPEEPTPIWKQIVSVMGLSFLGIKMTMFISKVIDNTIDDLIYGKDRPHVERTVKRKTDSKPIRQTKYRTTNRRMNHRTTANRRENHRTTSDRREKHRTTTTNRREKHRTTTTTNRQRKASDDDDDK